MEHTLLFHMTINFPFFFPNKIFKSVSYIGLINIRAIYMIKYLSVDIYTEHSQNIWDVWRNLGLKNIGRIKMNNTTNTTMTKLVLVKTIDKWNHQTTIDK